MTVGTAIGWDVFNAVVNKAGLIFWNGDEWTFWNSTGYYPDFSTECASHGLAVVSAACGGGSKNICVANGTTYCADFRTALTNAGHTVTVGNPNTGAGYDFVFCNLTDGWTGATSTDKCETMWTYVTQGNCGLYHTMGQGSAENATMATLLNHCGITYSSSYVLGNSNPSTPYGSPWPVSLFGTAASVGLPQNGAGQFTALGTPTSGYNARWQAQNEGAGTAYYTFAAWARYPIT